MLMMLPFEAPTIFEGIHKSYFRMPRVVKDQRSKFENDDLFRQLSHEGAVKYTGFKDRPLEERQMKFIANCQEGHTEVSVVQSGNQFTLMFNPTANPAYNNEGCDFDKELGKVHIKAGFILNGVCVLWRGWLDLQRLEGFGCLEFDEYRAYIEEAMLKQQIDKQAACNNNSANPLQTSPLGRLNASHAHISAGSNVGAPQLGSAAAVAAVAAMQQPSGVLNPSCLGPGMPPHPVGLGPPVSLAESAAHYGNAAIAAAAAAAFHQALGVGPPPPPALGSQGSLHGLSGPQSAIAAAAAAAGGQLLSGAAQGITYTNGGSNGVSPCISTSNNQRSTSPPHHHHHQPLGQNNNGTTTSSVTGVRSPEPRKLSTANAPARREATKRAPEEQTQLDDVDVVSDIHSHDLDFPPRRIFKSDPSIASGGHNHHHHHHHHHHRATRRA